jgi:uncharacterized coiled-coil DUF342 family protein
MGQMTDIVKRLRTTSSVRSWADADEQRDEAADEIERLRTDLANAIKDATDAINVLHEQRRALTAEVERVRAEVAALRKLLREARDAFDAIASFRDQAVVACVFQTNKRWDIANRIDAALAAKEGA